jgi:TonB family protein
MKSLLIVAVLAVALGVSAAGQDQLNAAKDLYASAAYEDALSALARIDEANVPPDVARQVDEYRAFCLFALGRNGEAETVAEALIRRQPLAALEAADTSPRIERLFSDVRTRLLPSLIRERFRTARAEIDRKTFIAAETPLIEARQMIAEAQRLGIKDDAVGDLSVLVDGFLQLIHSAAEQRPTRVDAANGSPAAVSTAAAANPAAARSAEPRPASETAAVRTRLYTLADRVSPPVVVDQQLPTMPPALRTIARSMKKTGMLDIIIDESGHVVDATIRQSLHSAYDAAVVRSAGRWKYEPATIDGVPVRFVKTIVLVP